MPLSHEEHQTDIATLTTDLFRGIVRGILDAARRINPSKPHVDTDVLRKRIILPFMSVSDEEMARAAFQDRAQRLARQDEWENLMDEFQGLDSARTNTPGGESAAMLMAFGARADVVASAEDALFDGVAPSPDGTSALDEIAVEFPDRYPCAIIAALAHLDIGWAWLNAPMPSVSGRERAERFHEHHRAATKLLAPFDDEHQDSPALWAARCALMSAKSDPKVRIADAFETLIALDPGTARHMRAFGVSLLPSRQGSYQELEIEARRTMQRTGDIWGRGGYVWVYLDALSMDPGALGALDTDLFIDGMRDILDRNKGQHVVNLLAAFCAIKMAPVSEKHDEKSPAALARVKLNDCLDWILSKYLHELHPVVWCEVGLPPDSSPQLPSRRALVQKGRDTALTIIALRFADQIRDGSTIAFSPAGMYRIPAL